MYNKLIIDKNMIAIFIFGVILFYISPALFWIVLIGILFILLCKWIFSY
jgi:hypothetical protein